VAISNQKVISDTPGPGDKHTVRFATTAKLSSYMAALVVGNFEYVEGEADGIPDSRLLYAGKKDMGHSLSRCRRMFEVLRPIFLDQISLRKLDLIGLPDFSAGAMENAG